jgi:hypothetical protein
MRRYNAETGLQKGKTDMPRWSIVVGLLVGSILLGACTPTPAPALTATPNQPPPIGWDTRPEAIIVRFDRVLNGEASLAALNRLPLCTIYGDGHIVWINVVPPVSEEVLEARLNDTTLRSFFDFLIREQRFYSLPDYAANQLPPDARTTIESITLNLNKEVRTIRNYGAWPNGEFQAMLSACTHLSSEPVAYLPSGAWLTVQPLSGASTDPRVLWTASAGLKLADIAAGKPIWLSGSNLTFMWNTLRRTLGAIVFVENDRPFRIALQVPGISRDSPPAPAATPSPVPTEPPTALPTARPTVTSGLRSPRGTPGSIETPAR